MKHMPALLFTSVAKKLEQRASRYSAYDRMRIENRVRRLQAEVQGITADEDYIQKDYARKVVK